MGNIRSRILPISILTVALIVFVTAWFAMAKGNAPNAPDRIRADIIPIDTMKTFGTLQRPVVLFPHDAHTEALKQQQKDCTTCHLPEKDRLSLKFKRLQDDSAESLMNIYHDQCISCHRSTANARMKSGPVTCGQCHAETPKYFSNRKPMGLDRSLHARHTKALENKCETCHHEYDPQAKKLVYRKEQEGTCRYCHLETTQENRIANRLASHIACIDCHKKTAAASKKAGPFQCAACHDPAAQAKIEKLTDIPRLNRKQPDTLLVKTSKEAPVKDAKLAFVPFDHKAHETYSDTCRVCHHKQMNACNVCHTPGGVKDGKFVTLEKAMHLRSDESSCMGCHDRKKADLSCAGCHAPLAQKKLSDALCVQCHMANPAGMDPMPQSATQEAATARALLDARKPVSAVPDETLMSKIPEKIAIKTLSDKYQPADFPHRKIVNTLLKNTKESKLAAYFHQSTLTLCQGCHHNSPASLTPPTCQSCHSVQQRPDTQNRPALMGAYHIQCMGCHQAMNMEHPMGCTECHKEKPR